MNLSDSIETLMKEGVVELTILQDTKSEAFILQAKHFVSTGPGANRANIVHQVDDASFTNAVERLKRQVQQANEMQTRVIQVKTAKL